MKADRFTEMGLASLLPGMRYLRDQMNEEIARLEQTLAAFQGVDPDAAPRRGRPPGSGRKSGWSDDPAERRLDMQQRMAKRKPKPTHPRDKRHPGHAEWLKTMAEAQKKRWKGLSAAERKKAVARLIAGQREARAQVNGAA